MQILYKIGKWLRLLIRYLSYILNGAAPKLGAAYVAVAKDPANSHPMKGDMTYPCMSVKHCAWWQWLGTLRWGVKSSIPNRIFPQKASKNSQHSLKLAFSADLERRSNVKGGWFLRGMQAKGKIGAQHLFFVIFLVQVRSFLEKQLVFTYSLLHVSFPLLGGLHRSLCVIELSTHHHHLHNHLRNHLLHHHRLHDPRSL